ncbi:MAG: SMP-30/gluconolactonase/LRE family protein [Gemmataceae bacterium]
MTRLRWLPLALLVCLPLLAEDDTKKATVGSIERLDPAFDDLIPRDARLEKLADGFAWTEGPVWVKKGGFLLFSDIPNNRVLKYKDGEKVSVFLKPAGYMGKRTDFLEPGSNGLLIDPSGRLVLMEHGDRRVSRLEIGKGPEDKETLAHKHGDKRLNSPNDGVFAKNGDLYFTDPPYGRMLRADKGGPVMKDGDLYFPERDLDYCGVYRLSKDGKLTLLTKEMTKPNGIALSPDEKKLYVANSDPKKAIWMEFPIQEDGTLGKGKVFADYTKVVGTRGKTADGGPALQLPDGMKVDAKGNLFATGPGGLLVFSPEGKHLGTLVTGVNTGNCCFGDDGSTLYVMCDRAIARIKTSTKGLGF